MLENKNNPGCAFFIRFYNAVPLEPVWGTHLQPSKNIFIDVYHQGRMCATGPCGIQVQGGVRKGFGKFGTPHD